MASIIVLGVFMADTTYRTSRMPRLGETIRGKSFTLGPGGKGSNQAVAAAKAGGTVHFVSAIGQDPFGDMALATWQAAGVNPAVRREPATPTGAACILVDDTSGDNAIIIAPGAALTVSAADIDANGALFTGASVFLTQLEQPIEAAVAGLARARDAGAVTILNPAPAAPLADDVLRLTDIITPNETEAELLTGVRVTDEATARQAADALIARGVGSVMLTMGARGVLVVDRDGAELIPAMPAGEVVETTGAGDAFNGGLAVGLSEGKSPRDAAQFGCAVAGISVTRPGAADSMPTRAEVDRLIAGKW